MQDRRGICVAGGGELPIHRHFSLDTKWHQRGTGGGTSSPSAEASFSFVTGSALGNSNRGQDMLEMAEQRDVVSEGPLHLFYLIVGNELEGITLLGTPISLL